MAPGRQGLGRKLLLVIEGELKGFLESDLVVSVGTRSPELTPNGVRGWGPRISEDGRSVELFIDRPGAATAISNLRDNGRIAVVLVHVMSNRAVQIKGRCVEVGDPAAEDWAWIERHREAFTRAVSELGFPAQLTRNLWSTQVVKVRFVVDDIFDQTPGPAAGRAL